MAKPSEAGTLESQGYLRSYRRIVMYEDLNAAGTIFGGKLVSWIDEASAIYASCQMNARRIVTKKISELIFNQPARLGDMLEIWCTVLKQGQSSLTIRALVMRRTFADDPVSEGSAAPASTEICRCDLVFVSVDENGRPRVWNSKK
jgi:acyl-CoA thioesterase YciA